MIRALLAAAFLIPYVLYGFILNLFIWIVRFRDPDRADRMVYRYLHVASAVVIFLSGTRVDASGLENLPEDGTVVYIMNHRSLFDVLIMFKYVKCPMGFIAKKSLQKIPVLAHWMELSHCIFLKRGDIKDGVRVVQKAVEYLKSGLSMGIFPEGTRNRNREDRVTMLPFHAGSFKLATKTDLPIVPVILYYPEPCFEEHVPFLRPSTVKFSVGEPIPVAGLSAEERRSLSDNVKAIMEKMIEELL